MARASGGVGGGFGTMARGQMHEARARTGMGVGMGIVGVGSGEVSCEGMRA